jgi:hypothetical protein
VSILPLYRSNLDVTRKDIIQFIEGKESSLDVTRKKAVIKVVFSVLNIFNDIGKGKVIQLQPRCGPEGG